MKTTLRLRFIASGTHFISSLIIFSLLLFIIIKIWYPQPFFSASGGWQGLKIIALIDVVLGPLITLFIYNINKPKKELKTDIGIIIAFQFIILSFGVYTIYSERPVAITFWEHEFYTLSASTADNQKINLEKLKQLSDSSPAIVYVEKPNSKEGLKAMLKIVLEQQISPTEQFSLFRPFQLNSQEAFQHSIDINEVILTNKGMASQLESLLEKTNTQQQDNYYLVLKSKYQNIILVFNSKAEKIGYLKAPLF